MKHVPILASALLALWTFPHDCFATPPILCSTPAQIAPPGSNLPRISGRNIVYQVTGGSSPRIMIQDMGPDEVFGTSDDVALPFAPPFPNPVGDQECGHDVRGRYISLRNAPAQTPGPTIRIQVYDMGPDGIANSNDVGFVDADANSFTSGCDLAKAPELRDGAMVWKHSISSPPSDAMRFCTLGGGTYPCNSLNAYGSFALMSGTTPLDFGSFRPVLLGGTLNLVHGVLGSSGYLINLSDQSTSATLASGSLTPFYVDVESSNQFFYFSRSNRIRGALLLNPAVEFDITTPPAGSIDSEFQVSRRGGPSARSYAVFLRRPSSAGLPKLWAYNLSSGLAAELPFTFSGYETPAIDGSNIVFKGLDSQGIDTGLWITSCLVR